MTTADDVIKFLEIHQQTPVLESPYASRESRLRIQTDKMRLGQLPVTSIARYIINGAACDTSGRLSANDQLEAEGFVSYRLLLPVMRRLFPDIWASADGDAD